MNLAVPIIGTDTGLTWEESVNTNSLTLDQHDHTPGRGAQIPPSGLIINTDLPFGGNRATGLLAVEFNDQDDLDDLLAIYTIAGDLFFNDGAGNNVQITLGGAVNATSSGISSGTATASFVSSTLVVNADVDTPANIKGASILLGNNTAASKYLTLQPPNAMAADYSLTLPALPGAQNFVTLDAAGNFGAPIAYSGGIVAANIAAGAIGTTQIAAGAVTLSKIASGIIPTLQTQNVTATGSFVVPAGVVGLDVQAVGGGGGGGSSQASTGAGGGAGVSPVCGTIAVTPGETLTITIGSGGAGATAGTGSAGSSGGQTSISRSGTRIFFAPGGGGGGGSTSTGGGTTVSGTYFSIYSAPGGAGGIANTIGSAGTISLLNGTASNGGAVGPNAGSAGGGGGGGGFGLGGDGGQGAGGHVSQPSQVGTAGGIGAGGGGGGAVNGLSGNGTGAAGSAGGAGMVRLYWIAP